MQGHPRVTLPVLFSWCKVRACLASLTPANILLAQQQISIPLPQILPPAVPQLAFLLPEKALPEMRMNCPDMECPPYSPPPKAEPPDPEARQPSRPPDGQWLYPELPSAPPTSPIKESGKEGTVQPYVSPITWALHTTSVFPVIRGVAPAGGSAVPPDRHQPLEYKIIKDLAASVRENGPHAPYTHSLLASLVDALMLPHDWKLLGQALLAPAD